MPTSFFRTGTVLDNRYWIACVLGGGGGGRRQVYLACDLAADLCPVAIKVSREDLRPEGQMLAILSHPRIPRAHGYFRWDGYWCLIMDWYGGICLDDYLVDAGGPGLPLAQVEYLAVQLCDVLGYLHERHFPIVHCDLKPGNILLTESGQVILLDFGSARFGLTRPPERTPRYIPGTPGYYPPEYARRGFVTARADIYGLGVVLNQLLKGEPPPAQGPFPAWRPRHPLGCLLGQMMDPDISRRPGSARALGARCELLLREAVVGPQRADSTPQWKAVGRLRAGLSPGRPAHESDRNGYV
jgi:serine/threonine protein kinase